MKQSLLVTIRQAMEAFGLAPDTDRILCAVSGGADSVCLLLALRQLGYEAAAVHVEHGIRREESLEDMAYVRQLCGEHQIPLRIVRVDAPAAAGKGSMTLEEAARRERWRALKETARGMGIPVIATAHQRKDQAETVLWNLIRGSSVRGLGGIRPMRREQGLTLIRPLLDCERAQIEDYLIQRGIAWRTDSTNADTAFTRNAIRLKILPLLEELNPEAEKHLAQIARDMRKTEEWLCTQTDAAWEAVVREDIMQPGALPSLHGCLTADCAALERCPEVLRRRLLYRMIVELEKGAKDIARIHVISLERLALGGNGHEISLPCGLSAFKERDHLCLTRSAGAAAAGRDGQRQNPGAAAGRDGQRQNPGAAAGEDEQRQNPGTRAAGKDGAGIGEVLPLDRDGTFLFPACPGDGAAAPVPDPGGGMEAWDPADRAPSQVRVQAAYMTWQGGEVPKKKYTKYLAYDTMAPCLVLRTRRNGDYLYVRPSQGRRKLKDYLIDEKVPRRLRDRLLVVAQGSHVLWVVGMRISEAAKVKEGTGCVRITVSAVSEECVTSADKEG